MLKVEPSGHAMSALRLEDMYVGYNVKTSILMIVNPPQHSSSLVFVHEPKVISSSYRRRRHHRRRRHRRHITRCWATPWVLIEEVRHNLCFATFFSTCVPRGRSTRRYQPRLDSRRRCNHDGMVPEPPNASLGSHQILHLRVHLLGRHEPVPMPPLVRD